MPKKSLKRTCPCGANFKYVGKGRPHTYCPKCRKEKK